MANPVFVDCPVNTWTKVATNVTSGNVHRKDITPSYLQSYVMTGDPAPTTIVEGVVAFENSSTEPISAASAIDVYIYSFGAVGRVRVDV